MTEAIPQQLLVELAEAFELYDVEGNGTIPVKQMDLVLKTLGIVYPEAAMLAIKQRKIDEGDVNVSFTELLHLITHQHTETEHDELNMEQRASALRTAFALFDPASTGIISTVDFRKALREGLKDAEIDALTRKADPNGSGKINYNALVAEMTGC